MSASSIGLAEIPVIDLGAVLEGPDDVRRQRVTAIDIACREVGFFAVTGHRIDRGLVANAHDAARSFFDLPEPERLTAAKPDPSYPYGYVPLAEEALSRSIGGGGAPDLKETYNVGPVGEPPRPRHLMTDLDERAAWAPTIWPSAMPELRPVLEAYHRALAGLASRLMTTFALALGLNDHWFEPFISAHTSALRLAHYPPLNEPPVMGRLRAGAHTDYGTLTILKLDSEPGLQVLAGDGVWVDVDAPDDAFVVNLGDLMARWTNDRWRSTMHRVVVPPGRHDRRRPHHAVLPQRQLGCSHRVHRRRSAPLRAGSGRPSSDGQVPVNRRRRPIGRVVTNPGVRPRSALEIRPRWSPRPTLDRSRACSTST